MFTEYKRSINSEIKWVNGDFFKLNPYYEEGNTDGEREYEIIELYGNRNYSLFSTLAGVRDYSDKIIPVSEPKGIPDDSSDIVVKHNEYWEGDGHTHSWLTLKEIRDYHLKENKLTYSGLISPSEIKALDERGETPDSWCQGTNQEGYERREWQVENKTLEPLIEKMQERAINLLQNGWGDYNQDNDEKIRIVFWFDN